MEIALLSTMIYIYIYKKIFSFSNSLQVIVIANRQTASMPLSAHTERSAPTRSSAVAYDSLAAVIQRTRTGEYGPALQYDVQQGRGLDREPLVTIHGHNHLTNQQQSFVIMGLVDLERDTDLQDLFGDNLGAHNLVSVIRRGNELRQRHHHHLSRHQEMIITRARERARLRQERQNSRLYRVRQLLADKFASFSSSLRKWV